METKENALKNKGLDVCKADVANRFLLRFLSFPCRFLLFGLLYFCCCNKNNVTRT